MNSSIIAFQKKQSIQLKNNLFIEGTFDLISNVSIDCIQAICIAR
jgi:hypothetical protein